MAPDGVSDVECPTSHSSIKRHDLAQEVDQSESKLAPRCCALDWMLLGCCSTPGSPCAQPECIMQGTESWERRLVEARHEHGLLEWELDRIGSASDPTQQLLSSPLPGIAALLCTNEEICARQQQLARAGALKRMRAPETLLDANTGGSAAAAAADRAGSRDNAGDAGHSPEQPRAAALDKKGVGGRTDDCSKDLEPMLVGLSTSQLCHQQIVWAVLCTLPACNATVFTGGAL